MLVLRVCALGNTQQTLESIMLQLALSCGLPKNDLSVWSVCAKGNSKHTRGAIALQIAESSGPPEYGLFVLRLYALGGAKPTIKIRTLELFLSVSYFLSLFLLVSS